MKNLSLFTTYLLLVCLLLFLPACRWVGSIKKFFGGPFLSKKLNNSNGSEYLVSIDGVPKIKICDIEKHLKRTGDVASQTESEREVNEVLEDLISMHLILRWVEDSGRSKNPEYVKKLKEAQEALLFFTAQEEFKKDVLEGIEPPTEKQIEDYYEKSKDITFCKFKGGVRAKGYRASSEEVAKEILEELKAKKSPKGGTDWFISSSDTDIDNVIKDNILSAKKFPSFIALKDSKNNFYAFHIISRKEPKYYDLSSVKSYIINCLSQENKRNITKRKLEELNLKYKVEIHESALDGLYKKLNSKDSVK